MPRIRSITVITCSSPAREQPQTTWDILAPDEYGLHANVNPEADHPRWSHVRRQRIGESLYGGMDLRKNFGGRAGRFARLQAAVLTA